MATHDGKSIDQPHHGNEVDSNTVEEPNENKDKNEEEETHIKEEEEFVIQLMRRLGLAATQPVKRDKVLSELNLKGVAEFILSEKCKKIIVMTGAGISTAAGIPDFRSPGTGLYSQLEKFNLPYPESIFELRYFEEHPEPFFLLAKEMYPGNYKPTTTHHFINLLNNKKLLLRNFTQNIDGLERVAGLPEEKIMAAHGVFHSSHCLICRKFYDEKWMKERIFSDVIPKCEECDSLVKPDIVFFGESLPERFFTCLKMDFPFADLLIVMGTSLLVQPFASLINRVNEDVPRLLINREKRGENSYGGFDFDSEFAHRDVVLLTDCDAGCVQLAEALGWKSELDELTKNDDSKPEHAIKN